MKTVQSADGTTIAFDSVGDGPALVVVLGALCDRASPASLAARLAPNFTVYAYDRRGRGGSGDRAPYSIEREIEDLDALIAAADGSAFVFGHSSGAVIALEAAARQVPITRLAIHEPPYIVDDTRTRPTDLTERVSALVSSGRRGDAIKLFLVEGPEVPPEVVAMMEADASWSHMEALAHTLPYDLALLGGQFMPADRLANIRITTLALSGGDSPDWARNTVRAVASAIPGAEHRSLAGQTHGVADDVLAPVLIDFFLGT